VTQRLKPAVPACQTNTYLINQLDQSRLFLLVLATTQLYLANRWNISVPFIWPFAWNNKINAKFIMYHGKRGNSLENERK